MSIMVGTGRGAQAGVLVKDAEALQALDKVDTLVIDKTGTLTQGKPKLIAVEVQDGFAADEVLALAAAVEANSEHPLALAILAGARERDCTSRRWRALPRRPAWASVAGSRGARSRSAMRRRCGVSAPMRPGWRPWPRAIARKGAG
jgi:Cu+-exporting ATPase